MTSIQQLTALLTALRGRAVKATAVTRVANAFTAAYRPQDTLSAEDSAALTIAVITNYLTEVVNSSEHQTLERAARTAHVPFQIADA